MKRNLILLCLAAGLTGAAQAETPVYRFGGAQTSQSSAPEAATQRTVKPVERLNAPAIDPRPQEEMKIEENDSVIPKVPGSLKLDSAPVQM